MIFNPLLGPAVGMPRFRFPVGGPGHGQTVSRIWLSSNQRGQATQIGVADLMLVVPATKDRVNYLPLEAEKTQYPMNFWMREWTNRKTCSCRTIMASIANWHAFRRARCILFTKWWRCRARLEIFPSLLILLHFGSLVERSPSYMADKGSIPGRRTRSVSAPCLNDLRRCCRSHGC